MLRMQKQGVRKVLKPAWTLVVCWMALAAGGWAWAQPFLAAGAREGEGYPTSSAASSALREVAGLELPYVRRACVRRGAAPDLGGKALVVEFARPLAVLSTLDGFRRGLRRVGNHYLPPESWPRLGLLGLSELQRRLWEGLGWPSQEGAMLVTGADMDNLSVQSAESQGQRAIALVTAGARGNAMRMAADRGGHVEPGTINVILLTNRALSQRAMARAVITATEAKTAALQDLDVRSSYTPLAHQATGTGTDEVLVVAGEGPPLGMTGGHTRMGELMAKAVYAGVREALARQNGLVAERGLEARLRERGLCSRRLSELIEQRAVTGLLQEALALEDAWRRGLWHELAAWRRTCREVAAGLGEKAQAGPGQAVAWDQNLGPLGTALLYLGCPVPEESHAP